MGGVFLLGSLALVAFAAISVARHQGFGRPSFDVRFRTTDAKGIWPGVFVTISGYRVGRVERVQLHQDGKVAVDLRIDEKYRPLVGPRSRVSPTQENPLSDVMLAISPDIARPGERRPRADLRLSYEPGLDLPLLLKDLTQTRLELDRTLQAVAGVVERDLPEAVKGFNGTLQDVSSLASTMAEETGRTSETARTTMEVYQQTGERLGESARETTRVIRSSTPDLVGTLREVRTLTATINRFLQGLGFDPPPASPETGAEESGSSTTEAQESHPAGTSGQQSPPPAEDAAARPSHPSGSP
jgi:phospholipid/cholesterol/gamma-HCH transport system substrate-binding protein